MIIKWVINYTRNNSIFIITPPLRARTFSAPFHLSKNITHKSHLNLQFPSDNFTRRRDGINLYVQKCAAKWNVINRERNRGEAIKPIEDGATTTTSSGSLSAYLYRCTLTLKPQRRQHARMYVCVYSAYLYGTLDY